MKLNASSDNTRSNAAFSKRSLCASPTSNVALSFGRLACARATKGAAGSMPTIFAAGAARDRRGQGAGAGANVEDERAPTDPAKRTSSGASRRLQRPMNSLYASASEKSAPGPRSRSVISAQYQALGRNLRAVAAYRGTNRARTVGHTRTGVPL